LGDIREGAFPKVLAPEEALGLALDWTVSLT
jgi:hypothetical protein